MQKTNIFICVIATKQNVFYSKDERIQANYLEHFAAHLGSVTFSSSSAMNVAASYINAIEHPQRKSGNDIARRARLETHWTHSILEKTKKNKNKPMSNMYMP